MARHRGKKRRGFGHKNKAIPIAPLAPIVGVGLAAFSGGLNAASLKTLAVHTTGYDMNDGKFKVQEALPFWTAMVVGGIVHKVANKPALGINRLVRKATMGMLEL
jgi:hypothetical protein